MIRKIFILTYLITAFYDISIAAIGDSSRTFALEIRSSYGFIIPHHLDMGVYTNRHFPCAEVNVNYATQGRLQWQREFNYPVLGIAYWYSNLGNTSILGDGHALFFFGRFTLKKRSNTELCLRVGCGLGYLGKKFEPYNNYKNLAIGSHLNANLQLQLEFRRIIYKTIELGGNLGLAHFSNGAIVTPNDGINVMQAGLSLNWMQGSANYKIAQPLGLNFIKHWDIKISIASGIKEIMPPLSKKYWVISPSADWIYYRSAKGGIGFGFDVFWDASDRILLLRFKNETASDAGLLKPGIKGIKQWCFGPMKVNFELGTYLYAKEQSKGSVYDKLGIEYSLSNNLMANLFLKTHYTKADFVGFGFGFKVK